jgi:hypothetical protein
MKTQKATVAVSEQTISRLTEGLGVNWCDAFGMGGDAGLGRRDVPLNTPCIPLADDPDKWALLLEELTQLKAGCIRFALPPDGFITKRGTMDFDTPHFERLERLNEWAGANGATIILDTLYVPRHLQKKGADAPGIGEDNRVPASAAAFAEHFAGPLLDYCVSERNWTQIRYYTPIAEPLYAGIFHDPQGDSYRAYAALLSALRKELMDRGLVPQRLWLMGPSAPTIEDWPIPTFHARGIDLDPLLDGYDQHEKSARFDGTPPNGAAETLAMGELIQHHLAPHVAYAKAKGKAFLVTELAHAHYGARRGDPNGPATHDTFLLDAEFIVRAINAGVQGLLRWSFLNPGDIDGPWQFLDTADGSYRRRENTFYGYANLIRYVRPHADVLNVHVESSLHPWPHIHACALRKAPQGDLSIVIVNDHESEAVEVTVEVPAAFRAKKLQLIRTDRTLKHALSDEIRRDGKGTRLTGSLPPRSLSVLTSLEYDALAR